MAHRVFGIGLAAAFTALFSGSLQAQAIDRVDPDGDFSNVPQRLIIRYADDQARDMAEEARNLSRRGGVTLQFVRSLGVPRHHVFQLQQRLPPQALEALKSALTEAPNVELVEEDVLVQPQFTPNDPLYPDQWHYFESTGGINLPAAWGKQTGASVIVAVLDTGYTNHSELIPRILSGYDFISDPFVANDGNGRDPDAHDPGDWLNRWECGFLNPPKPVPSSWHGTHTSGTVAASTNTSTPSGVAGVAFDAMVLPVRVLGKCGGYTSDIADGIVWASGVTVDGVPNPNAAHVINMSLGGAGACTSFLQSAIDLARGYGTTVVTSAGNSNTNVSGFLPANCVGVVAVAASDRAGNRAEYSNYGNLIDVTAPGGETGQDVANGVLSTLNDGATMPGNESYVFYQGTSMAAPHVSGAAALLYAVDPGIMPDAVEAALEATARPMPGSCSGGCGAGIIDASAAIDHVAGGPFNQPPTASFTFSASGLTVSFTDTSTDSDGLIVSWNWDFGDGNTSPVQYPVHTYAANGTYTVTLTVMDDQNAQDAASQAVTVDDGSPANEPPTASFTYSADSLTVTFTDTSTDDTGVVTWDWDFGDGNTSPAQHPIHTYAASGAYTVTLTVTDGDAESDATSQVITVDDGGSSPISLSTSGYKVRGRHHVDLTWSGAASANVDIFRDGMLIATTANDGAYTDNIGARGGAVYVYQVCEAGTGTCSDESTVVF